MQLYGVDTLVRIFSHFCFIYLAYWGMNSLRLDVLFKKGDQYYRQIRSIYLLLAIVIGYQASNFFLEIIFLMRGFMQTLLG